MTEEKKESIMDKEVEDFFEKYKEQTNKMQGLFFHFGRFYQVYTQVPSQAMAILYEEIFKVHEALLGTFLEEEKEKFQKIKDTMKESLTTLIGLIDKLDPEEMKEECKARLDVIKKAIPLMEEFFKKEQRRDNLYI